MRNIVKVVTIAAVLASSVFVGTGSANAAGIGPITSQVKPHPVKVTCNHPRCPKPTPAPVHGPFKLNPRGPIGGPVLR